MPPKTAEGKRMAAERKARREESVIKFEHAPNYTEFLDRCLLPNRPCLVPRGLVENWDVIKSEAWERPVPRSVGDKGENLVNWANLKKLYGTQTSPVVVTRTTAEGGTEDERRDMTIAEAVDLIQRFKDGREDGVQSVYIKDWHLVKQLRKQNPGAKEPYQVPEIFADDWMNNLSDYGDEDDFRFVYAGTRGSKTLLHRDVYTSYSWSTNVVGRKRWYLYPPAAIPYLRRFPKVETSELVPDVETIHQIRMDQEMGGRDYREFNELSKAMSMSQVVDQEPGETIFIPSNWYHQVENLTEVVSINRNWCNAVTLPSLYHSITQELAHAEEALSDVKDMLKDKSEWEKEFYELVQDVAVKDAGWAWAGFWKMVLRNLENRPTKVENTPGDHEVADVVLHLILDFEEREDAKWLDAGIMETCKKCDELISEHTKDLFFIDVKW